MKPGPRRVRRLVLRWLAAGTGLALLGAAVFVAWPLPSDLLDPARETIIRVTDRNGLPLREVRPDGVLGRAVPLPPGPIPFRVQNAFLSAEDHRFFEHPGVDVLAIGRTLLRSARERRLTGGASTITQQLARRLVPRSRTPWGKVAEALWALRLTLHEPKERLLREYLDRVALGEDSVGIEAAAHAYFRRPAAHLSTAQAALLAGMASSPSRFDPRRHPAESRARMKWVLSRMVVLKYISPEDAAAAASDALDLATPERPFRAPHFVRQVVRGLAAQGLERATVVRTTLDLPLQTEVERAIREELAGLAPRRVGEGAAIVIDNATGEILAWAGSADFFDTAREGQNDGVRALRQPGSALKPFAYGLALARGMTPADLIPDVEARFETPTGDFEPRNYDRRLHGPVRLRAALANSYNIPAVRVCERLGPGRVLEVLRAAGFASLSEDADHYGVGLVLGDGEVSLYEMARAYAGLARGGRVAPLVDVLEAHDARAVSIAPAPRAPPRRFLPAPAVALLTDILSDESARVPAFGLDNALRLPFPVAAKTGTSRAHVDNWTVGFTRERTVAAWVGNFDGEPMQDVSGITGAGPLFKRVMIRAMRGIAPAPLVDRDRFERRSICPLSGALATPACPAAIEEVFLPGTAPSARCAMHRALIAADGRVLERATDVGASYYTWARGEGFEGGPSPLPPVTGQAPPESRHSVQNATRLLVPGNGDEYQIDPGRPVADQAIPVRIEAAPGVTRLDLRVDGVTTSLAPPFVTRIPARPGRHTVELWDGPTRTASVAFNVRP